MNGLSFCCSHNKSSYQNTFLLHSSISVEAPLYVQKAPGIAEAIVEALVIAVELKCIFIIN
jgi:hypothetical protein